MNALALLALLPMLVKMLPALMPVISKVVDGADPNKAIKTVTDSVAKIGKLGLEGEAADGPSGADPAQAGGRGRHPQADGGHERRGGGRAGVP